MRDAMLLSFFNDFFHKHKMRSFWKVRINTGIKMAISIVLCIVIVAVWTSFDDGFTTYDMTWAAFAAVFCAIMFVTYHTPGLLKVVVDMGVGVVLGAALGLFSAWLIGNYLWVGLFLVFAFTFLVSIGDRNFSHPFVVKIGSIVFMLTIYIFPSDFVTKSYSALYAVLSMWLVPSILCTVIGAIIWPCFSTSLILPEVIEALEDFKLFFHALSLHIGMVAKKSVGLDHNGRPIKLKEKDSVPKDFDSELPTLQVLHEVNEEADLLADYMNRTTPQELESMKTISKLERRMRSHIRRLKVYLNDSNKESWIKHPNNTKDQNSQNLHESFVHALESSTQKLLSMRISATKGGFIKRLGSEILPLVLPPFNELEIQVDLLLDSMIKSLRRIDNNIIVDDGNNNNNNNNSNNININNSVSHSNSDNLTTKRESVNSSVKSVHNSVDTQSNGNGRFSHARSVDNFRGDNSNNRNSLSSYENQSVYKNPFDISLGISNSRTNLTSHNSNGVSNGTDNNDEHSNSHNSNGISNVVNNNMNGLNNSNNNIARSNSGLNLANNGSFSDNSVPSSGNNYKSSNPLHSSNVSIPIHPENDLPCLSSSSSQVTPTGDVEISFNPLDSLCRAIDQGYTQAVFGIEANFLPPINPSSEITRLSLFTFSATEFAGDLQLLERLVKSYKPVSKIEIYNSVFLALYLCFKTFSKNVWTDFNWGIVQAIKDKQGIKKSWQLFIKSKRWHFPLKLAVSTTSLVGFLIWLQENNVLGTDVNGTWVIATVCLVILPSLGATLTRGILRIVGTVSGGLLGYCISVIMMKASSPSHFGRIFSVEVFAFFIILAFGVLQQMPAYAYSGTVGALTFLILIFTEFLNAASLPDAEIAILRVIHIIAGVVRAFVVSAIIFPYRATNTLGKSLLDSVSTNAKIFETIIQFGLLNDQQNCSLDPLVRKEIEGTLATLGGSINTQKALLNEAKSELLFFRNTYRKYEQALQHAEGVYLLLISLYTSFGAGYSHDIKSFVVENLRTSLSDLIFPVDQIIRRIEDLRKNKADQKTLNWWNRNKKSEVDAETKKDNKYITDPLTQLDVEYFQIRSQLANQFQLGFLYPHLIQFNSLFYSIREFVYEWEVFENTVLGINRFSVSTEGLIRMHDERIVEKKALSNSGLILKDNNGQSSITTQAPESPSLSRSTRSLGKKASPNENNERKINISTESEKSVMLEIATERERLEEEFNEVKNSYESNVLDEDDF